MIIIQQYNSTDALGWYYNFINYSIKSGIRMDAINSPELPHTCARGPKEDSLLSETRCRLSARIELLNLVISERPLEDSARETNR